MPPSPKRPRLEADADGGPTRLRLKSIGHKSQQNMAKLWRDGSLCDVEIVVESQCFRAHRVVLAAGSDYMSALFCGDRFKDSSKESIELVEMTAASFKLILEWLYEGQCDAKESEIMDLLEAASRLQCVELVSELADIVAERLDADTYLGAWDAADRMQLPKLAEAAEAKALESYEELVSTEEFKSLSTVKLTKLLASDKLDMKSEEAVFRSVVSWAKAQSTQLSDGELVEIFDNVRFPLMSEVFIQDHVETEKLVCDNPRVMMSLFRSMKEKAYNNRTVRTSPRRCVPITLDEVKPGVRVRIKDDLEVVKAAFHRDEKFRWDDDMEEFIGREYTVDNQTLVDGHASFESGEWSWPLAALERVR